MSMLKSVLRYMSLRARPKASRPRRRFNKALVLCGLVVGLMLGGATSARAQTFDFAYSGSGISASGTFAAVLNVGGWYDIVSIAGSRTGPGGTQSITGLSANRLSLEKYNSPPNTISLWFQSGGLGYSWTGSVNGGSSFDLEEFGNYNFSQVMGTVTPHVAAVPEIDASSSFGALAVLFAFGLLMREKFLRRRFSL